MSFITQHTGIVAYTKHTFNIIIPLNILQRCLAVVIPRQYSSATHVLLSWNSANSSFTTLGSAATRPQQQVRLHMKWTLHHTHSCEELQATTCLHTFPSKLLCQPYVQDVQGMPLFCHIFEGFDIFHLRFSAGHSTVLPASHAVLGRMLSISPVHFTWVRCRA